MSSKQDFADRQFKIECSQIVLRNIGNPDFVIHGPGEIWQDQDGVLQYKIFINRTAYRALNEYMGRPGVIGELIPEAEFFSLQAQEHILPIWNAARVLPSPRGGPLEGLAHGYINELTQSQSVPNNPQSDFIEVRFKDKLNFPCNQGTQTIVRIGGIDRHTLNSFNVAFAEDGNYRFEVRHDRNHTVVSLQLPAGELTTATASRICEALQFVLGKELALMVIETSSNGRHVTRFTSPSSNREQGEISPPLQFDRHDDGGHIWRMFCNYFRRVHSDATDGWHPISRHIGSVIEASAASLDTQILALGVAVEGLVGLCFPHLAPVSPEFVRELDAIQASFSTIRLPPTSEEGEAIRVSERTLGRINGSLNNMRNPRNSDNLRAFITNNRLPAGLYNSWSRLRNTSAHGGGAATVTLKLSFA